MSKTKLTRFALAVPVFLAVLMLTSGIAPVVGASTANLRGVQPDDQLSSTATYGGRAFGVWVNTLLVAATFADTGDLPPHGGEVDATPMMIQSDAVTAEGLLSVTMGSDEQAESQAAVGAVDLLAGTPTEVSAFFAMATSFARCSGVSGSSDIAELTVAGQDVEITGMANQVVSIPGVLTLTINEQFESDGGITVNALHLQTALGTDIIVSSAYSAVSCATVLGGVGLGQPAFGSRVIRPAHGVPSVPGCFDFTTGGGWIVPASPFTGGKSTFGFVAGFKPGGPVQPRGNFEYHDHTFGLNIKALDVLYYNCGTNNPNSRIFGGHAEVNHVTGYCYQVYVEDNGEPGHFTDYLALWVWAPPTTCPSDGTFPPQPASYANGNFLGGGNIQIHA